MQGDFKVVTICGSTKFKDEFKKAAADLTLNNKCIVLTCNLFNHADNLNISKESKTMLDAMHKSKIDMSDMIYVINKDDYIGESTRSEIIYAAMTGKEIVYAYPHEDKPVFFELNNWMYGEDYPGSEKFAEWVSYEHAIFSNQEYVKENKLCVVAGTLDMSRNWCITAPESWVLANCPELLSDDTYTYTVRVTCKGETKDIKNEDHYSKFLRYREEPDESVYGRFDWKFLEYEPENIGKIEYHEDNYWDPEFDDDDDEEDEEDS